MTIIDGSLFSVAILPNPWPPRETVELFSKDVDGQRIALSADSRGSFVALLEQGGVAIHRRTFAKLDVEAASRHTIGLTWSARDVTLYINAVEIPTDAPDAQPVRFSNSESRNFSPAPILDSIDPSAGATDEERFFLCTLADIRRKVRDGDRYSLIRAAGLLRQLLLDNLVHVINRNHRVAIEFSTVDFTRRLPVQPKIHWQTLDASFFPGAATRVCSLDDFLAAPCLEWQSASATVKDLIRAGANAKGGVHLGRARNPSEQIILDWDEVFLMAGEEPSVRALAGICRVALAGLYPLAVAVMAASGSVSS